MDWSGCPDVERVSGKVSGAWLVAGTRIRADDVVVNSAEFTPEQIVAEIYPSLSLDRVKRIVFYARQRAHASNPA